MDGEYEEKMCMKEPTTSNADRGWTTKRLKGDARERSGGERDLDGLAAGAGGAAATGTGHDCVVATATAVAGLAEEEVVVGTLLARVGRLAVGISLALEDTGVHVRDTLGASGLDVISVHVDVAGNVECTILAEGDLPPCLVKASEVGKLGALVSRSTGRRNVLGERDDGLLSRLETNGDLGLVDVQGHAREAIGLPAEDDGVLAVVVGELGLPFAIITDPDGTIVALIVFANGADAQRLHEVLDTFEEVRDNILNNVAEIGL